MLSSRSPQITKNRSGSILRREEHLILDRVEVHYVLVLDDGLQSGTFFALNNDGRVIRMPALRQGRSLELDDWLRVGWKIVEDR
jgi:hypothetical protein